jgi:anti-anti-sigma factor
VELAGEIDLANVAELESRLHSLAASAAYLVVVLTQVSYLDSSGFGLLERLSETGGLRIVIPPASVVYAAFRVTGLAQLAPVFGTIEEALNAT